MAEFQRRPDDAQTSNIVKVYEPEQPVPSDVPLAAAPQRGGRCGRQAAGGAEDAELRRLASAVAAPSPSLERWLWPARRSSSKKRVRRRLRLIFRANEGEKILRRMRRLAKARAGMNAGSPLRGHR